MARLLRISRLEALLLVLVPACLPILLAGCAEQEKAPYNLLLITLDTTRADYIGCYGGNVKTPAIDGLAAGGVVFEHNVASSNCTNPSHASIMTGLYPAQHGVYDNRMPLTPAAVTLAEMLQEHGYSTLGAVSARHVSDFNSRFGQGFDTFLRCEPRSITAGKRNKTFLPQLRRVAASSAPFFAWVHFFDPHADYDPPPPFNSMYPPKDEWDPVPAKKYMGANLAHDVETVDPDQVIPLYKGEISYTDSQVGVILDELDELGIAGRTLVVLVADHGESMGEKEIFFSHCGLYKPVSHVPLIMRMPGVLPAGFRVSATTSSVDILPTVLDLLQIPGDIPETAGRSLRPNLSHPDQPVQEHVFCEAKRGTGRAIYDAEYKYIEPFLKDWAIPTDHLYRYCDDSSEEKDLKEIETPRAAQMRSLLEGWTATASKQGLPQTGPRPELDKATREGLEALGY
jgi:arylsulfatase A-like enzyme